MTDPRLLLLDFTSMSGPAATSTLKAAYFSDWQDDTLLHAMDIARRDIGVAAGSETPRVIPPDGTLAPHFVETFKPQIILYRPVADSSTFHAFSMAAIEAGIAQGAGLAIWMMDDWPTRLETMDADQFRKMNTDLRYLFAKSAVNFAISDGMARAFGKRYGVNFEVAHNGVDPEAWPQKALKKKKKVVIRYAGSLAPDTTKDSVAAVARTVSNLARRNVSVCLEGRTQSYWMPTQGKALNKMKAVSFATSNFDEQAYRQWLSDADILLVAYNFDEATRRYLKYSFANKVPETLAAGAAILAYGPGELETLDYLRRSEAALVITEEDEATLENAILSLIDDPAEREALGHAAREYAFVHFDFKSMKEKFRGSLIQAAATFHTHPKDCATGRSAGMGARKAIEAVAGPPPPPLSPYRRFANAVSERAPWITVALRPILRQLRATFQSRR